MTAQAEIHAARSAAPLLRKRHVIPAKAGTYWAYPAKAQALLSPYPALLSLNRILRRDGRADECGGLENRSAGKTAPWVRIPLPPP